MTSGPLQVFLWFQAINKSLSDKKNVFRTLKEYLIIRQLYSFGQKNLFFGQSKNCLLN